PALLPAPAIARPATAPLGRAQESLGTRVPAELAAAIAAAAKSDRDVRAFYAARDWRPLWIRGGRIVPEAGALLDLAATADADGLKPGDYRPKTLANALDRARDGSPRALARAEVLLSQIFADYVQDVRRPREIGMLWADQAVVPVVPNRTVLLRTAAEAPSLARYLDDQAWTNPVYAKLRAALAAEWGDPDSEPLLRLNLERARILPPADSGRRYVLVDAAGARLSMIEGGIVRDTMNVVVGKPEQPTPMLGGMIRFAILNPYWNIPPDLVRSQVAGNVLRTGLGYLRTKRYEILSDWSESPKVLDPKKIDWRAVAAGRRELRVRQLPGKGNAMGKMKFMFPNDMGIYLHDTSEKNLLTREARLFSSGCVRLEDAARLGRWLFGKPLVAPSAKPEQHVNLPEPVPVYVTYFTAAPEGQRIAFRQDVYKRDPALLARVRGRSFAAR
ncbi:L,D-transpeptidase, partial [Sphingomonas parva]